MDQPLLELLIGPITVAIIILIAQFFIQPMIQEEIKAYEELWLHKKDIYIKTIELIDKIFDSLEFRESAPVGVRPTDKEINNVYRELLIVCGNEEIIIKFQNFMDISRDNYCSPANRGAYIKLLRNDLGKSKLLIADDKIPYFRIHSNN